jgi:hypothetical protein
MGSFAASAPENLDGSSGGAEPQLFTPESVRCRVEVTIELHVIVDAESDPLPLGVLVRGRWQWSERGTIESLKQLASARPVRAHLPSVEAEPRLVAYGCSPQA